MVPVFFGKDYFVGRQLPVDSQVGVVPGNGSLAVGIVKIVTFILKHSLFAQYGKSVGKALGDEELPMAFGREAHGDILPEGLLTNLLCAKGGF